jgi:GNAT superfamily N-acetyltransferase
MPDYQRQGIGAALTNTATDWIREAGSLSRWSTPGATKVTRRLAESAGYTPMPIVRYFKAL